MTTRLLGIKKNIMNNHSNFFIFLGIVIFIGFISFVDLGDRKITTTAAVAILMALWWMTETLPLSITALVPLMVFPLLGILSASKISDAYINSIIFLFLGGFLIAIAIETWNLHKRIALKIILFFGSEPTKLLLGFMTASAFLSMWISNTATALMMLPVAFSVIKELSDSSKENNNLIKAILLGIAYSCSIGGIATLVGTQPNLVFVRVVKIAFPSSPQVNFTDWMMISFPISLVILILTYFLIRTIFGLSKIQTKIQKSAGRHLILEEYKKLGKMTFEEKAVATVFLSTIILWITRTEVDTGFFKFIGWANFLHLQNYVDDSTVAVASAFILFLIPTKNRNDQKTLLTIKSIEKIPWSVILLFGGGFALASAFTETGLSALIGEKLRSIGKIEILFLIFIISITVNFLTEFTSNTAVIQMILPVLSSLSITLNYHPYLLMIPATLSASMAFMLPVGTPPNTIVFSSNRLKIMDMVKTGFILNLVSTISISLIVYLLGNTIFDLSVFPNWAK